MCDEKKKKYSHLLLFFNILVQCECILGNSRLGAGRSETMIRSTFVVNAVDK